MVTTILALLLIVSIVCIFIYIYAVPWFKGTLIPSNNPNCSSPGPCSPNSWCCKYPKYTDNDAYCFSKKCSDIRVDSPTDNNIKFFNIYIIFATILMIILVIIKFIYKY